MEEFYIVQLVVLCLIALITIYLIAIFIKGKVFKSYSCFNIMLMSIILFLNCLLLSVSDFLKEGEKQVGKFILSFVQIFLNKMLLSILSLQVIIVYAGIIHTDYYYLHEKSFVKKGDAICAIISLALAAVYSSIRWVKRNVNNEIKTIFDENEYNDDTQDEEIQKRTLAKKILESIFCGANFFVNVFFLVIVIMHISKKRREAKAGLIQDLGYGNQLLRFSLIFSVNIIAIIFSGIVVNFSKDLGISEEKYKYCGICFLIICFLIELCFMINKTVYKETLRIFCKKKYEEIDDDEERIKRISTFEIDAGEDEDEDN